MPQINNFMQNPAESSTQIINDSQTGAIDISFQNIKYSVKVQDDITQSIIPWKKHYEQRQILKGVSGIFKAGQVTAIMGASGAGKTTLLNILACRINHNGQGKLMANNTLYTYESFGNFANYVMQNDLLMQTLTVRQTLDFAAQLKLNLEPEERKQKVFQLIKKMKLEKCIDTLVGGPILKGISGGERKRTSIAFELISDPQVIFLDQPTSGLDSLTSYIIISQLKKMAQKRYKTVIMTIHQPNSETYQLFDKLVLLLQGKIIYHDKANEVANYFEQKFGLTCPQFMNPSDFIMSRIHYQDKLNQLRYPEYFQAFEKFQQPQVKQMIQQRQKNKISFREANVSFFIAISALIHRTLLNSFRNPRLVRVKLIQALFMALFIGGMYFNMGKKDYMIDQFWLTASGFLFFVSIFSMTMSISPISLTFPAQRQVFLKEQDSKMYQTSHYFLAKNIVEIPQHFIIPLIAVSVYYFMVDLSASYDQFFIHYLVFCLMSFCGASLGLLLGSVVHDQKDVAAILPAFLLPMITFSGFFKNRADLPSWIGWLEYLSPNKYGFISLLQNQVAFRASEIDQLSFDMNKWEAIGVLFVLGVAFRFISLFFLWYSKKQTQ